MTTLDLPDPNHTEARAFSTAIGSRAPYTVTTDYAMTYYWHGETLIGWWDDGCGAGWVIEGRGL